jgi:hypothetical protein
VQVAGGGEETCGLKTRGIQRGRPKVLHCWRSALRVAVAHGPHVRPRLLASWHG